MNELPSEIQRLFEKYGRCKIVSLEYSAPTDHFTGDAPYSFGACVIVRTKNGEFVLVRHPPVSGLPGYGIDQWGLPCGKQKGNESLEEAGVRETLEETGLTIRITGLYRVFPFLQKALSGETRTIYGAVFFGEAVSGELSSKSPETLEVKKFQKMPENFAGELRKYYEDLIWGRC